MADYSGKVISIQDKTSVGETLWIMILQSNDKIVNVWMRQTGSSPFAAYTAGGNVTISISDASS